MVCVKWHLILMAFKFQICSTICVIAQSYLKYSIFSTKGSRSASILINVEIQLLASFALTNFPFRFVKRNCIQNSVVSMQTRMCSFWRFSVSICVWYTLPPVMSFRKSMNVKMYHHIDVKNNNKLTKIKFIIQMLCVLPKRGALEGQKETKKTRTVLLCSPTLCGWTTLAPQHFLWFIPNRLSMKWLNDP